MNNDWKTFLTHAGAIFADGIVQDFGNPQHEQQASISGTVMTDLSHLGIIRASGADAASFLQGQLTNDINQVNDSQGQISGYCNPQGRLLAIFQIIHYQGDLLLLLPAKLLQETLDRLKKYTLMAKITLEDVSDDWVRIGVYGKQAAKQLRPLVDALPEQPQSSCHSAELCVLQCHGQLPRYLILGPASALQALWGKLDVHAAAVGAGNWGWHDIQAGLPVVYPETLGNFIPQMVNLDILDAINFKKGCYTGQEIVARLHYRGKVKRRMYLVHISDYSEKPQPGDILYYDDADQNGQAVGTIVRCQPAPGGGLSLLAVIVIELAKKGLQQGKIHLQSTSGPLLEPQELPYLIEYFANNSDTAD